MGFMPEIYDEAVRYRDSLCIANEKNRQLKIELATLRKITGVKDPEQHFEQIMLANKQLEAENFDLKAKSLNFEECYKNERKLKKHYSAENERLKEFARSVIQIECWGCYEPDGFGTQDLAEKLGLVKSHIVTDEDINDESDFEAGDRIYKFADILKDSG